MMMPMRGRLRAPAIILLLGSLSAGVFAATQGWVSGVGIEVLVMIMAVAYYVLGGRDTDEGALAGHRTDERQAGFQRKAQALVGRVLSVSVMVAYFIAIALKAPSWPYEVLLVLAGVSFFVGLAIYR
jgi:dipeptide/tripeptide permease